jgi:hypothetical protein
MDNPWLSGVAVAQSHGDGTAAVAGALADKIQSARSNVVKAFMEFMDGPADLTVAGKHLQDEKFAVFIGTEWKGDKTPRTRVAYGRDRLPGRPGPDSLTLDCRGEPEAVRSAVRDRRCSQIRARLLASSSNSHFAPGARDLSRRDARIIQRPSRKCFRNNRSGALNNASRSQNENCWASSRLRGSDGAGNDFRLTPIIRDKFLLLCELPGSSD